MSSIETRQKGVIARRSTPVKVGLFVVGGLVIIKAGGLVLGVFMGLVHLALIAVVLGLIGMGVYAIYRLGRE
jgi:hypothetical protein